MKKLYYLLFAFAVTIISCTEKEVSTSQTVQPEEYLTTITKSELKDLKIEEGIGKFGKYMKFFTIADATIGLSSSRYNPLDSEKIMAFYQPGDNAMTKSAIQSVSAEKIIINGCPLFAPTTKSSSGSIKELFGETVSFNLKGQATLTKSSENEENGDVTLYAPEIIQIQFPKVQSEEELLPLCYYKDFVVRWNKDEKNTNGVLVAVRWEGDMIFGENYPNSYICRTVCVPDTGEAEIPEELFEDIPDTAFCDLYLFRGDVENIDSENVIYKVLTEVHDMMNFVLIRYIE